MQRNPESHKGENGTVAVIGGSRHQHGAPLFSALAAEATGVDLLHLFVPAMHAEVAKHTSLNFQVRTFGSVTSDEISPSDRTAMVEFLATIDAVVVGPGLSRSTANLRSLFELLEEIPCPVVLDATALQRETLSHISGRGAVLTPHLGELERMGLVPGDLPTLAQKHACTFLLKAHTDQIIVPSGKRHEVQGGNPGLTVGGTGDALAGTIAGLLAQKCSTEDACTLASTLIKRAGDTLSSRLGFAYTTRQIIAEIPALIRSLSLS